MKRTSTLKRTAFGSHRPKPKRHPLLVPKALGESAVRKGPVRSKSHLERVREQPCLICGATGVHAHHSRVGLRTMGVRKDDTKAVPLCPRHHDQLHSMKEEAFWDVWGVDPLAWCAAFTLRSAAPAER